MTDNLLLKSLMAPDFYIIKRQGRTNKFTHGLYCGNMLLMAIITYSQYKRIAPLLKEKKHRMTLNLNTVRSMHGKSSAKIIYKQSKINSNGTRDNRSKKSI